MALDFNGDLIIDSNKRYVLGYGLTDWQIRLLNDITENICKDVSVLTTNNLSKIFCTDCIVAFVSFKENESKIKIQSFIKEIKHRADSTPLIYLENYPLTNLNEKMPNIMINTNILQNKDKLRLILLQEIKNMEGLGRLASENSMRLTRVLKMYQHLIYHGWINKEVTDTICNNILRIETVSRRMFQRDMKVLKEIDSNISYNKEKKYYVHSRTIKK